MATSEIILPNNTHSNESSASETVTGDKFKGDGYYGRRDGVHTVQYTYSAFTGTITIQATLALDPIEEDWFTAHSYETSVDTGSRIINFTGNYVWIRAFVSYLDGTIESIVLNH